MGNGTMAASQLALIDNGQRMAREAAPWLLSMFAAAAASGIGFVSTEGYRTIGVPADRFVRFSAGTSDGTPNQWYQRGRWLRGETPAAAIPGTSKHGEGLADDVNVYSFTSAGYRWLQNHAAAFGFSLTQGRGDGEPWHIVWVGGGWAALTVTVIDEATPKKRKREKVLINIWNTNKAAVGFRGATIGETTVEVQRTPTVPKAKERAERMFGPALEVSQEEFDGYLADVNNRRQQLGLSPLPAWPTS